MRAVQRRMAWLTLLRLMIALSVIISLIFTCWSLSELKSGNQISRCASRQRLLCFVLSDPNRVASSLAVKQTWGSRCDALLFFSSRNISVLPSVTLPEADSVDGYYRLWGKVRGIWKYLEARHLHQFDWFLKADDDTYIVVDNLRSFLDTKFTSPDGELSKKEPAVWLGARLRHPKASGGYHSGGASYVLSRRALQLFQDGRHCSQMNFGYEDLEMGRCLGKIGIDVVDTRDSTGLPTFLPFSAEEMLTPRQPTYDLHSFNDPLANRDSWYWKTVWWPHQLVIIREDETWTILPEYVNVGHESSASTNASGQDIKSIRR